MRFSVTVLFAASLASAYTIGKPVSTWFDNVTACGQTCYANTSASPCNATDMACQCMNLNYITALATCVSSSCSVQDAQAAQAVAVATCQTAGINLTNPVPACAAPCDQIASSTCTDPNDGACPCKDTTYIQAVDTCFKSSCQVQDITTAETAGAALCRAYGVDISSTVPAA
ncbi:hypothetical protein M407DRAFT_26467 [Tulasnella calospora MUT 4182]|uniref:CFEM domain-containing protein n=1 Tax=Tulasnella calospora MUT 4182 TaxID=1051891 RepID=A0A0C3QFM9_9AGAM|nr:hypothetical protein M407DRAFT_26467 [Tulasnella calospora MUT 4182]